MADPQEEAEARAEAMNILNGRLDYAVRRDNKDLLYLAHTYLHTIRCPHCDHLSLHGYLCVRCGRDPTIGPAK